jgi:hypothetical protein
MKQFIKKIFGIDKIEAAKAQAEKEQAEVLSRIAEAKVREEEAKKAEELAKLTPKERATAKGEPWVAVLDTKVNKDNVRNGFFELDWNEQFVEELKKAGYGFEGDPVEEIVDRWFRDLARNILAEEGQDTSRGAGFIDVTKLPGGKAEVK